MRRAKRVLAQQLAGCIGQGSGSCGRRQLRRAQHPGTGRGRVGDAEDELGVIGRAALGMGIGPAEVEYELAPGMPFEVSGRGGKNPSAVFQQQMERLPAIAWMDAAVCLEGVQELVAQERIVGSLQPVPGGWLDLVQVLDDSDIHGLGR